jgi:DNA-binding beta-propeller fold protein YncE
MPWKVAGCLLLLVLLMAQPATAATYPLTIPYGRSWPLSIVVDSERGFAYVDGSSGIYPPTGFSFGVINVTSHDVVKALPLNEIPGVMALDQATGNVYIAGNYSIQVFNAGNQSMGRIIRIGHPILSVAYDGSVSQDIFVTAGNQVYAVNPQSGRIMGNATVGNGANGMVMDPANGKLFVAEYPDSEIFVYEARDLASVGIIRLPTCCADQLAFDQKTDLIFATTSTPFVDVLNAQTDVLVNRLQVGGSSQNSTNTVTVDNQTGRVFVSSSPGGSIVEVDSSGNAVVGDFKVSSEVAGIAVDSKTNELYATNYHQVTVFDLTRLGIRYLLIVVAAVVIVAAVAVILIAYGLKKPRTPVP